MGSHKHSKRPVSLGILELIKWTIEVNHHSCWTQRTEATTSVVLSGVLSRTRDFLRFFLFHQSWLLFSVVTLTSTPGAEHSPLYPSPWDRFWTFPFCPSLYFTYFIFYSIWSMILNFWSFSFYLPSPRMTDTGHHACFMQCWGPDWGLWAY